ncbi:protein MRG1 [Hordeum vulgare]|nr:protein MRG1 [Hordeum vulgare]
MGGSSNTTTTTSGGGGGKDRDRDKGKGASVSFAEGEKVLAYHGPLLYEAKVQKTENREDEWRYFVHYLGWNKNWDEWVASDRLLKLTEENVRKQLELKNQSGDKTVRTGGRSAQHNPKASNADAKVDKEDTKGLVKGKKRKNQLGVEEKERRSSESLLMSQFPVTLKKQLVDDWSLSRSWVSETTRATFFCEHGRRCTQQTAAEITGHSQVSAEETRSISSSLHMTAIPKAPMGQKASRSNEANDGIWADLGLDLAPGLKPATVSSKC